MTVLGGVDVSWNTWDNAGGHWQAHLYLLGFAADTAALRNQIKAAFPPEPTAEVPYMFKAVPASDFAKVASYAVKADLYHRSGYVGENGRKNTQPFSLKPEQAVEAALFRDRYSVESRLLLKGLKRYRTSSGWVLKKVV